MPNSKCRTTWRHLVEDAVKTALKPHRNQWLPMQTIVELVEAELPALKPLSYRGKSRTIGQFIGKRGFAFPQRRSKEGTIYLYYINFTEETTQQG